MPSNSGKQDKRFSFSLIIIYNQWNITQPLIQNEILLFVTAWMDAEDIMLSEINVCLGGAE